MVQQTVGWAQPSSLSLAQKLKIVSTTFYLSISRIIYIAASDKLHYEDCDRLRMHMNSVRG